MDVRRLKDSAADYFRKGRFAKAAEVYLQLTKLEPKEGQHLIKLGDSYRRDGKRELAIGAYRKAVDDYARQGIVIKAIAACKLILEIDPSQKDAQEALATLASQRYVRRDQLDTPKGPPMRGAMSASRHRPTAIELDDVDDAPAELETSGGERFGQSATPEPAPEPPRAPVRPEPPHTPPVMEARVPPRVEAPPPAVEPIEIDFATDAPEPPPAVVAPAPPEPMEVEIDLGLTLDTRFAEPPARRRGEAYDLSAAAEDFAEVEPLDLLEPIEEIPLVPIGDEELEIVEVATRESTRPPTPMADILSDSLLIEGEADDGEEVELLSITAGESLVTGPVAVSRGERPPPPKEPTLEPVRPSSVDVLDEAFTPGPIAAGAGRPTEEELARERERAEIASLANEAAFAFTPSPDELAPDVPASDDDAAPTIPSGDVDQQSVPLFSELPREAFLDLLEQLAFRRVDAGDVILREGDAGKSIYVLASGRAKVVKGHGTANELELATLDDGAFFGEMALLNGAPRVASVVAVDDSEVLELTESLLRELTAKHPSVGHSLKKFYRQRLLSNVMAISPLFRAFDKADRKMLVERFKLRETAANEPIIREGERPDGLYVIMHGTALVSKKHPTGTRQVPLAVLKEGDVFGEMSLLTRQPASATVIAKRRTLVLRLPKVAFDELMFTHPAVLEVVSELTDQRTRVNEEILAGFAEAPREALALV